MDLVLGERIVCSTSTLSFQFGRLSSSSSSSSSSHSFLFLKCPCPSPYPRSCSLTTHGKKKGSSVQPIPKQRSIIEEEDEEEELQVDEDVEDGVEEYIEDFGDEILEDDNEAFDDEFEVDEAKLYVGDGGAGGGISLAGTWWDRKVLTIAEEVSTSFDGDLKIYAFKTTANLTIRIRIEKLSRKYGSPAMTDIEAFSSAYQERLDGAERAGDVPENLSLEVSSPGVERVIRIPEELERFKEKPMYVRYTISEDTSASPQESDGVFKLVSYNLKLDHCTWGIADVKINRKQAGKGRPLSKKQREWRLETPFDSLILVRIHSDC